MTDITGKRYGKLTVVRFLPKMSQIRNRKMWLCRCDCGNEVIKTAGSMRMNNNSSCGCYSYITQRSSGTNKRAILIECNGEKHSISEWSRIKGINYWTLYSRLMTGMSTEEALTKRVKSNGKIQDRLRV